MNSRKENLLVQMRALLLQAHQLEVSRNKEAADALGAQAVIKLAQVCFFNHKVVSITGNP